jgi:hypothetical protein
MNLPDTLDGGGRLKYRGIRAKKKLAHKRHLDSKKKKKEGFEGSKKS